MNTTKSISAKIINGPDRLAIASGFAAAFDKANPVHPMFTVQLPNQSANSGTIIRLVLVSVGHEDGSGQRFILKGNLEKPVKIDAITYSYFEAYYNAGDRTGYIKFS